MEKTIGFIGCGNMGGALLRAVCKSVQPKNVYVSNRTNEKAIAIAKQTGCNPTTSEEIAKTVDYLFLGVKPQNMQELIESITPFLQSRIKKPVIISMAAGIRIDQLQKMLKNSYPVLRIMPNLPVGVGEGVILISSDGVNQSDLNYFSSIMKNAGKVCFIKEEQMNAGCALSGCSPAYVFYFIQALKESGIQIGLDEKESELLAAQTVLGSAKQFLDGEKSLDDSIKAVCSPGGMTIEGVQVLNDSDFKTVVKDTLQAAYQKGISMEKNQ